MQGPRFAVYHPVATAVFHLLVILVGVVGYSRLAVRQFPAVEKPQVQVQTAYPGASSELVEREITTPVEAALSGIAGISRMTSESQEGLSRIQLDLDWGVSTDSVMGILRDRVSGIQDTLPANAHVPQIYRQGSDNPLVMYLSVQSTEWAVDRLYDYAERYIQPALSRLMGVSTVEIMGGAPVAMRIYPDPARMAASQVTVGDLLLGLHNHNVALPSGKIQSADREYAIATQSTLTSLADVQRVVVRSQPGYSVRVSDVAEVNFGADPSVQSPVRLNGDPALIFKISADQGGNPIAVAARLHAYLNQVRAQFPTGLSVSVLYDATVSIQHSIQGVYRTLVEAVVLVGVVMWLFLGSWRAALIPLVTIPVCLLGICVGLYALGFSINNLTLLAAVLAIGLVVDDAIVMVENVCHRLEKGMRPLQAVLDSGREMAFPIIAMTTTLAAVYAPIAFTAGLSGQLFQEFALTLSGTVLISGAVALTGVPVLCHQLLKNSVLTGIPAVCARLLGRWTQAYQHILPRLVGKPLLGMAGMGVLVAMGVVAWRGLPQEFVPLEDTDVVMVALTPPVGASPAFLQKIGNRLTELGDTVPEVEKQLGFPGFHILFLKSPPVRTVSSDAIAKRLFGPLQGIPGVQAYPFVPSPLGFAGGQMGDGLSFYIRTSTGEYTELAAVSTTLQQTLAAQLPLQNWDVHFKPHSPQLVLAIDRERAILAGVSVADIAQSVQALFAGVQASRYETGGQLYDIWIQLPPYARKNAEALSQFYVRNNQGHMIPIANVIRQTETVVSPSREHVDRMRAIEISANLKPGYTLGQALADLQQIFSTQLPAGFEVVWGGQAQTFLQEGHHMLWTFLGALAFIYLVLAAQFESFFDPWIILLTVPFSVAGGLFTVYLAGGSFNIYTQIACITLVGLITKHGILIVSSANHLRQQGMPIDQAVAQAAASRLRPILMTTMAMVSGAIPLIWAHGYGSVSRAQIGWVIAGGMGVGTVFSLVLLPIAYRVSNQLRDRVWGPRRSGDDQDPG